MCRAPADAQMRVAIRAFNAHLLQQRGEAVPAPAPEAEAAPPPAGGTGPMMTRMRGAMVPRAGDRAAGAKTVSRGEEIEESSPTPKSAAAGVAAGVSASPVAACGRGGRGRGARHAGGARGGSGSQVPKRKPHNTDAKRKRAQSSAAHAMFADVEAAHVGPEFAARVAQQRAEAATRGPDCFWD